MSAGGLDKNSADHTISGLWIGAELSVMERLSITSFLSNGHEFHLFVYSDVKNIPTGTVVRDAEEILPESAIFVYRDSGSYAGFSNFFRYELLWKYGGWWVDLDVICLRPFQFADEYVIGSEPTSDGGTHPTSGVLKTPFQSSLMEYLRQVCRSKSPDSLRWGETGPRLVADGVTRLSLERYLQASSVFCPVGYYDWARVLDPGASATFDTSVHAIHLWHEMWRRSGRDEGALYHPDCLYERLKGRYL
jgi:hypothetical protein